MELDSIIEQELFFMIQPNIWTELAASEAN